MNRLIDFEFSNNNASTGPCTHDWEDMKLQQQQQQMHNNIDDNAIDDNKDNDNNNKNNAMQY